MGDEFEEFYEKKIVPNLPFLTSTLRVDVIQQRLVQQRLINEVDDQTLRLPTKTPIEHATHFLNDLLKDWLADEYKKFCDILVESAASYPPHKTIAQTLGLPLPRDAAELAVSGASRPSPATSSRQVTDREVTDIELDKVAAVALGYWREIGLRLGFSFAQLEDYVTRAPFSKKDRLFQILGDWKIHEGEKATTTALVKACTEAKAGGAVKKALSIE